MKQKQIEGGTDQEANKRPWEMEPDALMWEHAGFCCFILRHPKGLHLCGYVGIPAGHPLFGAGCYEELSVLEGRTPATAVSVYRGLSYSGPTLPEGRGAELRLWWFGFDCGHIADDYMPGYARLGPPFVQEPARYKDIEFVRKETEHLATQLAALTVV